jgi:hypothetical protein
MVLQNYRRFWGGAPRGEQSYLESQIENDIGHAMAQLSVRHVEDKQSDKHANER